MAFGLTVVTGPTVEPMTTAEVKSHLRLSLTDDDNELETVWMPAARREIEKALSAALVTQTLKLTLDCFPGDAIEVPINPVQSISWVKYYDDDNVLQTLDSSAYDVDVTRSPCRVIPSLGNCWPSTYPRPGAVQVQFVAGYGLAAAVPATLKAAFMIQVREMFEGNVSDQLSPTVERLLSMEWDGTLYGPQG